MSSSYSDEISTLFGGDGGTIPRLLRQHIKGNPYANLPGIQKLIDGGHDPNHFDVYGNNAMHWACNDFGKKAATDFREFAESVPSTSETGIIKFLLNNRVNHKVRNNRGMLPLHFAVRSWDNPAVASLLIFGQREMELHMQRALAPLFLGVVRAVKLVLNCDRATLFLADRGLKRLWSVVADSVDPIVIPWDKGLAGACFRAEKHLNIADAWLDLRFENKFDKLTGYRTRTVLVCPILRQSGASMVLGVVQAINKFAPKEAVGDDEEKDEEVTALFDESDEELLKKICVALSRSFSILMSLESSAHERRAAEENFIHEIEDIVANCAGGGDVEFHFKSPKYRYVSPATKIREPGYEIDGQLDWKRLHRHGVVVVNPDSKISWTVAKLLRAKAGLIDAPSLNDQTPLMLAAIHGNVNVIRNLLTSGANPYLSDRGGDTALHYAAKAKQIGALKLLLGAGCDPLRLNGNALSAFQICCGVQLASIVDGKSADLHNSLLEDKEKNPSNQNGFFSLKAATALWIRILHRGHNNTWGCQNRLCPIGIHLNPMPSNDSIFGQVHTNGMNVAVMDSSCFACGNVSKSQNESCREIVALWPYKEDGKTPTERWQSCLRREMAIRCDIKNIEFWQKRKFLPLSKFEKEKMDEKQTREHSRFASKLQDGGIHYCFIGSQIGMFVLPLQAMDDTFEMQEGTGSTLVSANWQPVKVHDTTFRELIPRGWRYFSFRFNSTRASRWSYFRVKKNSSVAGKSITVFCGKSIPKGSSLRSMHEVNKIHKVFTVPVHSLHCIVTKSECPPGNITTGNDTVTITLPERTTGISACNYYIQIDEGSFLIGESRDPGGNPTVVSPLIEIHFVTDAGQTAWTRSPDYPLQLRRLVVQEMSLSHFNSRNLGFDGNTPELKKKQNAFNPFFLPRNPPRMVWRSHSLAKSYMTFPKQKMDANPATGNGPKLKRSTALSRLRAGARLSTMVSKVAVGEIQEFYAVTLQNYAVSIRFKVTKVAFKDNILFRICMTSQKDSKGQSLAFEYDWPTAQFIINGKISKGRRKQNDPNTSGGCLINDPNESNKIIAVYPFNEFAAPTVLQALDWSCGERLSINADEFSMPQNYTEWIEASCVGNTLSKGKDRVRYNPFTHEFQFDFQLNRRKRSTHHHILPDTKYDVTLTLLYDKKAVNSVTAQGISFSSCHICSGVTDKIIYQPGDFGTRVRYWPPINHGDGEKKARHPQSLKVNVLNGHVREHQREIEERKKALNKCKEGRRLTRSASSADHKVQFDAATVYEKRLWGLLKLHDKITQSPSNAALFMGDWYGSIEMRQMSFSRKRLRYMAKTFGGIWPEALLTMIITIYLQEDDVLVFQSITLAIRTLEDKLIHSKQVCYPEVFENGGTPELQDQKAIGNPVDGHNSDGKDRENKLDREEDGGCVVN